MTIIQRVINKFGKIPTFLFYKDLAKLLGIKVKNIYSIESKILDTAEILAKISPRKRFIIALHDNLDETAHKMINTLAKGTYTTPHKHTDPNTSEEFTALRGSAYIIEFSEEGEVINKLAFGEGCSTNLIEIKPNSIHSILPITDSVTLFEVKGQTSYDTSKDKSFYPWAPKEDDNPDEIKKYLDKLEK